MKSTKVELLAPAGSWEALEAAVNAGADAVYMGGTAFGARQYANNFERSELERAVKFAHLHRVRIYITVNTLVDDLEIEELIGYLVFLEQINVDGIIVQDFGVIKIAQEVAPALALHASTQMTITNSAGAEFAYNAGMERVVLARECSLQDIKNICESTKAEIEVFVHGALCVCYSGQCLMSSLIGGRSGNRGRCAQPCRLPYDLVNKQGEKLLSGDDAGKYLLSPRDMNTLNILPDLLESGVASLKIEGRMKRPEYVAVVVDIYRRAIDSYLAGNYHVPQQDHLNIKQIFNRDFTTGFLEGNPGKEMMSDRRPNNRGVQIGRVISLDYKNNSAVLKLDNKINIGDELEFWITVGGRTQLTLQMLRQNNEEVTSAGAGEQVEITVPKGVKVHDRVFRTLDRSLMNYAHSFCGESAKRRIPVTAEVEVKLGEPLVITLFDEEGNCGLGLTNFQAEIARKHPLSVESIRKQLERLGNTEYMLATLELRAEDNLMVPVSEINEARRKAVESLDEARLKVFKKKVISVPQTTLCKALSNDKLTGQITVQVDTVKQAEIAAKAGADTLIIGGEGFHHQKFTFEMAQSIAKIAKKYKRKLVIATPRVIKENQLPLFQSWLKEMDALEPTYFLLANNSLWELAKRLKLQSALWADWSLNTFNNQTREFWAAQGACGVTLSPELTMQQVERFAATSGCALECLVQGRLEMMVTEYCLPGSFLGNLHKGECASSCQCQGELYLQDRKEELFPIVSDQFCRMHILNAHELSMLKYAAQMKQMGINALRIDARIYEEKEIKEVISLYKQVLAGDISIEDNMPHTTRGHYFRGVL